MPPAADPTPAGGFLLALLASAGVGLLIAIVARRRWPSRRRALGEVRFRLGPYSPASRRRTNWRSIAGWLALYVFLVAMTAWSAFSEREPNAYTLIIPAFWAGMALVFVSSRIRRDRHRWLHVLGAVLAGGLWLYFVLVAVLMGVGVLDLPKMSADPRLLAVVTGFWGGIGLGVIDVPFREARGTTFREGGMEIGGTGLPWGRFKTYRWLEDALGCDLVLIGPDPGRAFGGIPISRRLEWLVPVPPAEKAAVDAFLAERIGGAAREEIP